NPFAVGAPNAALFDRAYRAPRSVRSNVQWSGPILDNRFTASVDATYSVGLWQPASVDLNFTGDRRFAAPDEGRPVFVDAASIDARTGTTVGLDARRTTEFSHVTAFGSSARSLSRQIGVRIAPAQTGSAFQWS